MTTIDDHGRPEPPVAADEVATLLGFLDYQRATLEWKTRGLDAAGLGAHLAPTSMTLGGLLKHLAYVEDHWFSRSLHDQPAAPRGTPSTGRPTRTGTGARPPTTRRSNYVRSGGTPSPVRAH